MIFYDINLGVIRESTGKGHSERRKTNQRSLITFV